MWPKKSHGSLTTSVSTEGTGSTWHGHQSLLQNSWTRASARLRVMPGASSRSGGHSRTSDRVRKAPGSRGQGQKDIPGEEVMMPGRPCTCSRPCPVPDLTTATAAALIRRTGTLWPGRPLLRLRERYNGWKPARAAEQTPTGVARPHGCTHADAVGVLKSRALAAVTDCH